MQDVRKRGTNENYSRRLDDEELDSGDDLERRDREEEEEPEEEYTTHQKVTMELELPRQPIPEPSDGEVHSIQYALIIRIVR